MLAGLAGREVDRAAVADAVAAEAALAAARRGRPAAEVAARFGAVTVGTPPLDVDSHQELLVAAGRLREQLVAARAQVAWHEHLLSSREAALRRAERAVELFTGSPGYRASRFAVHALRRASRVPGGLRRRWRALRTGAK
ncbi:hypothetical protein ACFQX7_22505 [Luedemannella flava]